MTTAYDRARVVEAKGLKDLEPFIAKKSCNGQYHMLYGAERLATDLQKCVGDVLFRDKNNNYLSLEIKVEQENRHKNFFLETWSNRKFGMQTPGWMVTSTHHLLMYYFLEPGDLYVIPFGKLWDWFWGSSGNGPAFPAYREVTQSKYDQPNITVGRPVPIQDVLRHVGLCHYVKTPAGHVLISKAKASEQAGLWEDF